MDDKIKKLIVAIKNGDKRENELLMEKDVQQLIKRISKKYAIKNGFVKEEVYQNCIMEFYDLLRTYTLYDDAKGYIKESFLGYLNKYLMLRMNNYYDSYTIYRNVEGFNVSSLNAYDSYEFLDEDLQTKNFENNFVDLLNVDNYYDKFSNREKQVFNLLTKGYEQIDIANELNIDRRDVHRYKKRIIEKIK